ncbi:gp46 [Mycobacterium phage Ardmore]|uniref:Gp46 n=1 Tax=Mycobacterium phage Ardmore TaxID=2902838 RepID=D4N7J1_9CAUD|nr:gp46 [Mycobacterium phage Ardmore]ACY39928.1 gp46 [Mycobacterium phage Ardmore]
MSIDLDRITHPLRLAKGSHQPGSGKGCAMNVISYINGDTKITDYPECSARPLAALVQMCNDQLAGPDGFLSPENSVLVLDLGWKTVGTAGVSDAVHALWIADMLDSPEWGAVRFADEVGAVAIREIADLHRQAAAGQVPFAWAAESAAGTPHGAPHGTPQRAAHSSSSRGSRLPGGANSPTSTLQPRLTQQISIPLWRGSTADAGGPPPHCAGRRP